MTLKFNKYGQPIKPTPPDKPREFIERYIRHDIENKTTKKTPFAMETFSLIDIEEQINKHFGKGLINLDEEEMRRISIDVETSYERCYYESDYPSIEIYFTVKPSEQEVEALLEQEKLLHKQKLKEYKVKQKEYEAALDLYDKALKLYRDKTQGFVHQITKEMGVESEISDEDKSNNT